MKSKIKRLGAIAGASVALAALIPASAAANPASDVRQQIRNADQALALATDLVAENGGAQDALAALEMAKANVAARKAAASAKRIRGAEVSARARGRVAAQFEQNLESFAALIGDVGGDSQGDIAGEIEVAVNGRDKAVAMLTDLLDRVPGQAVPGLTRAIAAVTSGGDAEGELAEALTTGEIAEQARAEVEQALTTVVESVQNAVSILESLVGQLPPEAQGPVQDAIGRIQGHLDSVIGVIGGLFGGGGAGGGTGQDGTPPVGGLPPFLGGLLP